ncbi:hypothetical protein STEG23_034206, partial [Scotinomys teguina]
MHVCLLAYAQLDSPLTVQDPLFKEWCHLRSRPLDSSLWSSSEFLHIRGPVGTGYSGSQMSSFVCALSYTSSPQGLGFMTLAPELTSNQKHGLEKSRKAGKTGFSFQKADSLDGPSQKHRLLSSWDREGAPTVYNEDKGVLTTVLLHEVLPLASLWVFEEKEPLSENANSLILLSVSTLTVYTVYLLQDPSVCEYSDCMYSLPSSGSFCLLCPLFFNGCFDLCFSSFKDSGVLLLLSFSFIGCRNKN